MFGGSPMCIMPARRYYIESIVNHLRFAKIHDLFVGGVA